jgi:20S proteasome subunit beta 5
MRTIIARWDKKGPQLFYIENDGTRLKRLILSEGSESTFAYGVLDSPSLVFSINKKLKYCYLC